MASASSRSVARATRSAAVSPAAAIHAHVERLVALKTEAATGSVKLQGRHAEIGERAIDQLNARGIEHPAGIAVIGVNQLDAIGPGREIGAGVVERVRVAIKTDQPGGAGFDQRAGVTAKTDGEIDEQPAL